MPEQSLGEQGGQRPQPAAQRHVGCGFKLHRGLAQHPHGGETSFLGARGGAAQRGDLRGRAPLALREDQDAGERGLFSRARRRPARIALWIVLASTPICWRIAGTASPAGPIPRQRALHDHLGHVEGAADVPLGGAAAEDPLAGEKAESGQVILRAGEDRQMAVEISDLAVSTLERQGLVQMCRAGREQGQLHLRHVLPFPSPSFPANPQTAHRLSSPPAKSPSGPALI